MPYLSINLPTGSTGLTLPLLLKVVCLALGCMHAPEVICPFTALVHSPRTLLQSSHCTHARPCKWQGVRVPAPGLPPNIHLLSPPLGHPGLSLYLLLLIPGCFFLKLPSIPCGSLKCLSTLEYLID